MDAGGLRQQMEEFGCTGSVVQTTAIIVHWCTCDVSMGRGRKDKMAPTHVPISVIAVCDLLNHSAAYYKHHMWLVGFSSKPM